MLISIVVLTYNRRARLAQQMMALSNLTFQNIEIIIVDNCSDESVDDLVLRDDRTVLVRNVENKGAVGRNCGMAIAGGEIVITLDDDVYGITDEHLQALIEMFEAPDLAAVNFKIQEEGTGRVANWCHPYDQELYSDKVLQTNHISEGAVAIRRTALEEVGLYPELFFISHEGPDLAFRLINADWSVIYSPEITVTHAYESNGRTSWRRYYYDTRNQLWFVLRNLSFCYGVKRLAIGWGAMLVFSVRDGYLRYWLKGVLDALVGAPQAWRDRSAPTAPARKKWREIERYKPGFFSMVRKRLFTREVKI